MTDKPIIFSGPMVRALLDGRKTQTRRIIKIPAGSYIEDGRLWAMTDGCAHGDIKLPIASGDRLWIKETWRPSISADDPWHVAVLYPHTGDVNHWNWSSDADFGDWTIPKAAAKGYVSPLFMPRWASRLTLTVTDVRVQRLQDISEADAKAEGPTALPPLMADHGGVTCDIREFTHRNSFRDLWNSIHGPDAWDANPWVAAYTFTVEKRNIDQ